MKLGERFKYEARRYLYQLEQDAEISGKKIKKDIEKKQQVSQAQKQNGKLNEYKKYSSYYEDEYSQYDMYYNQDPYYKDVYEMNKYNSQFEEYPLVKDKNNNLLGKLSEMEEYLAEQLNKIKR